MSVPCLENIPRESEFAPELASAPIAPPSEVDAKVIDFADGIAELFKTVWREVAQMLKEGLKSGRAEEWVAFWQPKLDEYRKKVQMTHLLAERVPGFTTEKLREREEKLLQACDEKIPGSGGELHFLNWMTEQARARVRRFAETPVRDPSLEVEDLHLAGTFNHCARWYGICLSSIMFMSAQNIRVAEDVEELLFGLARQAAQFMNHASMEAESMRKPVEDGSRSDEVPVERIEVDDADLCDASQYLRALEQAGA